MERKREKEGKKRRKKKVFNFLMCRKVRHARANQGE